MIPFFLFFATAVATCLLTRFWDGHGVASAGVQEVGYGGAAIMLLAAYISAFTLWAGRCVAGLALAVIGTYLLCENIGIFPRVINLWVALVFLLLVVATVYVIGSFRVSGVQNALYPRQASAAGKMVAWLFIIAPIGCFAWWAFWQNASHDEVRTVPMRWEAVKLDRVTSGRHQLKFTALDSSMSVTVASDELYDELESAQKKSVDMMIKETFKHGTLVAWSVESIDGSENFSLLEREFKQQ